ncbi:MAG: DNA methyltransferase [Planctomycetota bacterium]
MARAKKSAASDGSTAAYRHPEATTLLRPEVGTQAQFKKKKAPAVYRYDSSLSPALEWDGQNGARGLGEWLLARIDEASRLPGMKFASPQEFRDGRGSIVLRVTTLGEAVAELKRLSRPFLDWAGKAERLSFEVPTLPLFVHERLGTKAVLESLRGHRRDRAQGLLFDLYGDPEHAITDQVLKAYEHQDKWVNRMVLGDSMVVMNSLLKYEGLGGQVQMIYIDPPYGVKFGSNFQPFVRKRDVKHGDDDDMSREPEMVKAYRDTWDLGLHSYLTYLRDRLLLARELLTASGSVFVQISDENLHHVRELMDEVFGAENVMSTISFRKTTGASGDLLPTTNDYLLWYARDRLAATTRFRPSYLGKVMEPDAVYKYVRLASGEERLLSAGEPVPPGARLFCMDNLTSPRPAGEGDTRSFEFDGKVFTLKKGTFKTDETGLKHLAAANRLGVTGETLRYKRFADDFPAVQATHVWDDTSTGSFTDPKVYVVQTGTKVIQRCMLMTTDPGDLVLDPTCGSGTTAYVAEQWGRRWITIDTSRVPLALARQRLLTATFPYYELKDEKRGPAGGFHYVRKQNKKGEEVGGIVPHVTLKSIANNEPPAEEVLVDCPEQDNKITRISGPFVVEGTIPTPIDWDNDGQTDTGQQASDEYTSHKDRMLEVLRRSPVLHLPGNKTVTLTHVRPPAKTLSLSAEAKLEGDDQPVAIVFGPENGAVAEKLVYEAAREARAKSYAHLYVIGFAIAANARKLVDECDAAMGIPATYVQCTPDLMMGDLLKNLRSSQIFSVCGLPDVALRKAKDSDVKQLGGDAKTKDWYQVELLGLDVYDPAEDKPDSRPGSDVPCWMVDADYNGLCFKATQVFFPRTAAWDDLKRELKGQYDDSVWAHLAGTTSTPFRVGEHKKVAAKVIDDRGNELLVVKDVQEAQA